MIRLALIGFVLFAGQGAAQEFGLIETAPLEDQGGFVSENGVLLDDYGNPIGGDDVAVEDGITVVEPLSSEFAETLRVKSGSAAVLRGLDKVSGLVTDLELTPGEMKRLGRIEVTLGDCRYPATNPSGDAFAWLDIKEAGAEEPAFSGWMIASSPALSAMDHARYDVWVISCKIS
jgi:hypothetical protein